MRRNNTDAPRLVETMPITTRLSSKPSSAASTVLAEVGCHGNKSSSSFQSDNTTNEP